MEYCLSFSGASKEKAEKWALVLATLCTAVFPLVDFVTDILVAYEFKTADDPAEQAWGDVSCGILGVSAFLNLAWFWVYIDVVVTGDTDVDRLWSRRHYRLNVLIGFAITAANLRAQAMACILLWKLLSDPDATKAGLEGDYDAGLGLTVGTKAVTMVKLVEFFFEAIPELLLQGYAVLYRHYVNCEAVVDGNAVLLVSMSVSLATLISGLSATYLWANGTAVMVLGAGYFLCIVFGRMALFVLLFLQFGGSLGAVFAAAALLLRYVYVLGERRVNDPARARGDPASSTVFDPPTILIVPVGLAVFDNGAGSRALAHTAVKAGAGASAVLYSPDALRILALHVAEAAVGAALLRTCGGRSVVPFVPPAGNATELERELVVEPGDILWYVVWPYCAGLAMLALLVVVDKNCTPKAQDSQEAPADPEAALREEQAPPGRTPKPYFLTPKAQESQEAPAAEAALREEQAPPGRTPKPDLLRTPVGTPQVQVTEV